MDLMKSILAKADSKTKKDKEKAINEMNAEFSKMRMDINDHNIFSYYNYPGWPINIHTKRTSTITNKDGIGYIVDEIKIEELE